MLLKYLNDLDRAVEQARACPGVEQYSRCAECLFVLEDYLQGQVEPVRRRAEEIIEKLLPRDFNRWMLQLQASRQLPALQAAGSL